MAATQGLFFILFCRPTNGPVNERSGGLILYIFLIENETQETAV